MKKNGLTALHLGGSLYIPATHKNVLSACTQRRFAGLRSAVVCTEDSITDEELPRALETLRQLLDMLEPDRELILFFRPRNPQVLEAMLRMQGIGKIDGFVLPKFDTGNMDTYLRLLEPRADSFYIMPVMESREMFEPRKLCEIRQRVQDSPLETLCIRIGGEDMLGHFGLKKDCGTSLYDLVACSSVLADIIKVFKPYGFFVSAPVYNCIRHPEIFRKEVEEDLKQGFTGKTIIHPDQIAPINEAYRVSRDHLAMADAMLQDHSPAVIVQNGAMGEKSAHLSWARSVRLRANIYGIVKNYSLEDHIEHV